jgi:hypothetical protein
MSSPVGDKRKLDSVENTELPTLKKPCREEKGVTIKLANTLSNEQPITLTEEQTNKLIANSDLFKASLEGGYLETNKKHVDLSRINCEMIDHLGDKDAVKNFISLISNHIEINSLESARNFLDIPELLRGYFHTETLDQKAKIYLLANGYMKDLSKVLKLYHNQLTATEIAMVMARVLPANQNSNTDIPDEGKLLNALAIGLKNEDLSKAMGFILDQFKNRTHVDLHYKLRHVNKQSFKNILDGLPSLKSINFINKNDKTEEAGSWDDTPQGKGFQRIMEILKKYSFERLSFNHVEPHYESVDFSDFPSLKELEFHGDHEDFGSFYDDDGAEYLAAGPNVKKVLVDSRVYGTYYASYYERAEAGNEKPFQLVKKVKIDPSGQLIKEVKY